MPRKITHAPSPPSTTTAKVASKTEEQPFKRTKQEETLLKPKEDLKNSDNSQITSLEDNTLPVPPKATSSSPPTKQPSKLATKTKKPGVGKKMDLEKGKEATLKKVIIEEKPYSSGVGGGNFWAGIKKFVEMRGMMNEGRKLLVNVGMGVFVIAALGVLVSYTIGLIGKRK
ncbi:hypothetical protein E3N88_39195 [Mikania micrantha]|uniref:Uncharacterized protein n=1 Tax=Mikania micrantha TaxID=192012 RepID=A0A5N6LW51_9ASTR|nr:hypothetical protein E3N88_39195 [Mikania micrantha]